MNFVQKSIFFGLSFLFYSFAAQADVKTDIKVVTTIKPLHSLISRIMESRGEPQLIIEGTNNPHTFVFKPSHAEMLEEADIVFWIGEDLEAFMEKPLDSLAKNAKKIAFMESDSIEKLKFREKNIFDDHDDHDDHVEKELSKDISYVVFHDAYQYFETRFDVTSAGALTLNPDVLPGARQIADIQDLIRDKGIKCIFSEPQYNPKIIETLGNDMNTYTGVMDPLGAFIDAGPTMYVELINGIANSIKECH